MKRWKAVAGILLIFVAGCAAGAAIGTWLAFSRMPKPGPDMLVWALEVKVKPELNLTAEQEVEFRKLCDETRAELSALHVRIRPQFEEILDRTDKKLHLMLNEEQRKKLDQIRDEFQRNHKRDMDRP